MKKKAKVTPRRSRAPKIIEPNLAAHIITFDADDARTYAPYSLPLSGVMQATARAPIPWPTGNAPTPTPRAGTPNAASPLPQADYVVVTWTVEEAKSLADTLTPGYPSQTAWYAYTHNFASEYVALIRKGAPALQSKRLGSWFPTQIAGKHVLCFKSELHLSQDGPKLPIAKLWQQIIKETGCKLIITTGTAGGIGAGVVLGDVVVAQAVRFDCAGPFKNAPFHDSRYICSKLKTTSFADAQQLFTYNQSHLPAASRAPRIFSGVTKITPDPDVVTTDFFAFDDSTDHYQLEGLGAAVEMGDAVLGMVVGAMGNAAPRWIAIRNASDPQIDSDGISLKEAATKAAQIYEKFGYWTTIPSAITCWATILDN